MSILTGSWDATIASPMGPQKGELVFTEEGGKDAGVWKGSAGSATLQNVSLKGDAVTFDYQISAMGMSIPVNVSAKIAGSKLSGTAKTRFGDMPLTAEKRG